jgi:hypothetical protein
MRILSIVIDMSNVSVSKCVMIKFQGLIVRNCDFFVEPRKPNTMLQNDRSRVDRIINRVVDISNVSVRVRDHVKVSIIEIYGLYVYALRASVRGVLVKMSKIRNSDIYLYYERDQDSYLCDASGWTVNVVICFVEVLKIKINVADLLNERGLDIYLSDANGWNVSVIILKL